MKIAAKKKTDFASRMFMNPLIRKLSQVEEHDSAHCATYRGITTKTIYFLITLIIGIILNFVVKAMTAGDVMISVKGANISTLEVPLLLLSLLLTGLIPFLAFIIRPTIPVTGALYCIATGYLVSWLATTFADQYAGPVWLALIITILLVAVMAVLYSTGTIKVTKKFKTVISTLFITSICAGLLTFIGAFIPAIRPLIEGLQNNFILSILGSIFFIVIATLFLLVDFDTIRSTVENQLPKKYEWVAAFGLTFTVIWLYFKVLDLILQIKENGK